MSHISRVKQQIADLDALKAAARRCGVEFRENQRTRKWYYASKAGECDHAIGIAGNSNAYEIGVRRQADGTYALDADFFAGGFGLEDRVGAGASNLVKFYHLEAAKIKARRLGFSIVQERELPNGVIFVDVEK